MKQMKEKLENDVQEFLQVVTESAAAIFKMTPELRSMAMQKIVCEEMKRVVALELDVNHCIVIKNIKYPKVKDKDKKGKKNKKDKKKPSKYEIDNESSF